MKYDYWLFDFDGTVAETGEGIRASVAYALEKLGRPVPEKAVLVWPNFSLTTWSGRGSRLPEAMPLMLSTPPETPSARVKEYTLSASTVTLP